MRIQSTTQLHMDLLHKEDDVAKAARFAARYNLAMSLGPSPDDNFLAASFAPTTRRWAYNDSALSVIAQAMAADSSVDDVLAQIRTAAKNAGVDPALPFDITAEPVEAK